MLLSIFYQDLKERMVYWPLFLLVAISCGFLHYKNTYFEIFTISVLMNLVFISILLGVVYLYSNFKLKVGLNESIGIGDILLFVALSFSFSTISFIVIFVFSLIFSLALHLILKKRMTNKTVALAGNMSLFFALTYISYWLGFINSVYNI